MSSTARTAGAASRGGALGKTPIAGASVPRGLLHWKGQLAGHEIAEDVGPGPFASTADIRFTLFHRTRSQPAWSESHRPIATFQISIPSA